MRIVCDTNILVSGIVFGGNARRILSFIAQGELENCISSVMLEEARDVLSRPKFNLDPTRVAAVLNLFRETFTEVMPSLQVTCVTDDPDDDRILEAAYAADAQYIITGDKHLLVLKAWEGITIINPADFLIRKKF